MVLAPNSYRRLENEFLKTSEIQQIPVNWPDKRVAFLGAFSTYLKHMNLTVPLGCLSACFTILFIWKGFPLAFVLLDGERTSR